MKRIAFVLPLMAVLYLHGVTGLCAATQAYIPSNGDGNVARVTTGDETVSVVAFGDDPYGAAVDPEGDYLVVTHPSVDSITIVAADDFSDPGAQHDLAVGDDPRGVAFESQGNYAYVANYGDDTVSEVRMGSFIVTDTFSVGDGPLGVAAIYDEAAGTRKIYVANNMGDSISVVTDDTVETITGVGDGPAGLALSPDGQQLYVALYEDDALAVVRTNDNTIVKTITVGNAPWGVAVGSGGAYLYVTNTLADTVTVIATDTLTVYDTFGVGNEPRGVACPKYGDFAYVVNRLDNDIARIDIIEQSVTFIGADQISDAYGLGAFIGGSPPQAPSDLSAETGSSNRIQLSWSDNSSDELGFKIERRRDTDDLYEQIASLDADVTSYRDTSLQGEITYHYRVRAYNETNDSDYSASVSATTEEEDFSWCFIGAMTH